MTIKCPVCLNKYGGGCVPLLTERDASAFNCEICGPFELSGTLYATAMNPKSCNLSQVQRATFSHQIRKSNSSINDPVHISTAWFQNFLENAQLPSPAIQALNTIRFIGESIAEKGEAVRSLPLYFYATIGAASPWLAGDLFSELVERGLVNALQSQAIGQPKVFLNINLTLSGWEEFEKERKGERAGKYGFLAMKFGDQTLEPLIKNTVKPLLKETIGYELIDMRDISKAGIIDNIMRAQIRDAAFVIVDLTHDNSGAYWEAGYAEGLGKPVIYICEKSKFESAKTHFDTNHCTTVLWSMDEINVFKEQIVATLRRSLNLFS